MNRTPHILLICGLAILALSPVALEARSSGRATGKVRSSTGDALRGAVIAIFRPDHQGETVSYTRTDSRGIYRLANLTPGTYYLEVTRQGYQPRTTADVRIDPGKTTSIDITLQEIIDLISNDSDPRNWDLKTIMRSTSDRRLIFRDLQGVSLPGSVERDSSFYRSGVMSVASNTGLSSENYMVLPETTRSDIISNFAITEPVSQHARMIFSGQLTSGYDSFWRVRDTYNYRPDDGRDYRVSVGYGRMNFNYPAASSITHPTQFFSEDPSLRESGVQSLAFGFEGRDKMMDTLAIDYGFDYSRIKSGTANSIFSPFFQVVISPSSGWSIKSSVASRRASDTSSVVLPDGEFLNLSEPTFLTKVGDLISMTQFKHSEISVERTTADATSVEIALYEDHTQGPGLPFLVTANRGSERSSNIAQLSEDQSGQHGLRVTVNRKLLDFLSGSIAYVYGTATNVSNVDDPVSSDRLARNLASYMQQSYYHSITSQLNASFPRTKTRLTTIVRWYPGNPLTPIDLFADRMDIGTKSVNFQLRQAIPLPEFMAIAGRWEALVDVRNLFDQGRDFIRTTDGEVILTHNPRCLRFGLNLNFY